MVSQASKFKDLGAETKMHFCKQHYRNIAIVVVVLTVIGLVIYLIAQAWNADMFSLIIKKWRMLQSDLTLSPLFVFLNIISFSARFGKTEFGYKYFQIFMYYLWFARMCEKTIGRVFSAKISWHDRTRTGRLPSIARDLRQHPSLPQTWTTRCAWPGPSMEEHLLRKSIDDNATADRSKCVPWLASWAFRNPPVAAW